MKCVLAGLAAEYFLLIWVVVILLRFEMFEFVSKTDDMRLSQLLLNHLLRDSRHLTTRSEVTAEVLGNPLLANLIDELFSEQTQECCELYFTSE